MLRHFYATAEDFLPVFDRIESKRSLNYTLTGLFQSPKLITVAKGKEIATLGSKPEGPNCPAYLVTPIDVSVHVREVPQYKGGMRYAVDQLINPDSITLSHGGFFSSEILLDGNVGTVSDSTIAKTLFRAFANAIAKEFCRIKAFWVGPQATELLHQGCRLACGADSPPEFDLVP